MDSTRQRASVPPLTAPDGTVADSGKLRYGDGCITGGVPPLTIPDEKVADPGKLRYGDGCITAGIPLRK
jgi:hypothetical protein